MSKQQDAADYLQRAESFWDCDEFSEAAFGRVFVRNDFKQMSPEQQQALWEQSAQNSSQQVVQGIPVQADWRVLELGCGVGRIIKPLRARFSQVDGVDFSSQMITHAQHYLADVPGNGRLWQNNGRDLADAADASYELVFSLIVFQHIHSVSIVRSYFRELARILKPGGWFRLQVMCSSADPERKRPWNRECAMGESVDAFDGNTYSEDELRALLEDAGLRSMAMTTRSNWLWANAQKPCM